MTNETLEEIFYKKGKFVNSKGKKVNPKIVGLPKIIYSDNSRKFVKNLYDNLSFEDIGANTFLRGKAEVYTEEINKFNYRAHYNCAIQFYKI